MNELSESTAPATYSLPAGSATDRAALLIADLAGLGWLRP
jgi:hypothetical protein